MLKLRTILFSLIAVAVLMSLSSATARAQANPTEAETKQWRQRGPCRDPWVSQAVSEYEGRIPRGVGDFGECSPALYAGGSWSSYAELYRGVTLTLGGLDGHGISFAKSGPDNGVVTLKTLADGVVVGKGLVRILTNNGGTLISSDGAGIISHDGGTFIVGQYNLNSLGNACKKVSISGGKYFVIRKCG